MHVYVTKHAVKRYKQRILKRNCKKRDRVVDKIKKSLKTTYKIIRHYNYYIYYTEHFRALVDRQWPRLYIITIMEPQDYRLYTIAKFNQEMKYEFKNDNDIDYGIDDESEAI